MVSIKRGLQKFTSNRALFFDSFVKNFLKFLPDKLYLSLRYRCIMGRWIDWKAPQTFTEKIQWLKVYNRRPEFIKMVDKHAVKEYVANIIGSEYIIPTIGVWNNPSEIDWDSLPNQFVLKTTHGGGSCGVVICRDKSTLNKEHTIAKLFESLKYDIYTGFREWPYKDVPRRIIAEKLIAQPNLGSCVDLSDYKFFCFNGEPIYCQVIRDRNRNETIDFYDMKWSHQEFVGLLNSSLTNGVKPVPCPKQLSKMIEICRCLSKELPFVRVDLYVVGDRIYFGEITFYPASGFGHFKPADWDYRLGNLLSL